MHTIKQKHYGEACRRHAYNNCVFRGYLRSFAFSFSFDFIDGHLKIFMGIAQAQSTVVSNLRNNCSLDTPL